MDWLTVSLLAYFLLALVNIFDKLILKQVLSDPKEYVFYVGLPLAILIPLSLFFPWPAWPVMWKAILSGFCFNLGLFWVYKALKNFDSSSVVPIISGLVPIMSALLVFIFYQEAPDKLWPFILLVCGSVLAGLGKNFKFNSDIFVWSILSAFFLAASFVGAKIVFDSWDNFVPALIWIKIGGFVLSIAFFLLFSKIRSNFLRGAIKQKGTLFFYANQILGVVANVLQNYAIKLAPLAMVSSINALQGTQHVFLFFLAITLGRLFPKQFNEDFSWQVITSKLVGIILIFIGLWQVI